MEMRLELIPVPVSDPDVSKDFYVNKVGFNADHDQVVNENLRFIQLTPPGSHCSICIGKGIGADMKPGSIKGLQLVVDDIQKAYDQLKANGVAVSEIDKQPWGHFVYFKDPDGNEWSIQYMPYKDHKSPDYRPE